jgi:xylulokinase
MIAVGGGAQGGLWTRIVSDVTGAEQQVPAETVGAAYGDALLATLATGVDVDPQRWNPIIETIRPDPAHTDRYQAFYQRYRELYEATKEIAHFLAQQQRTAG